MPEKFSPLAVIVTFNPDINLTYKNVQNLNLNSVPVLIVDNRSKNVSAIRSKIKKQNFLIENESNLGLGFALNRGIEYAQSNLYTHVWLFDQDSFLEISAIRLFLQKIREYEIQKFPNEKVASYGPNIFDTIKNRNIYGILKDETGILNAKFLITSGSFYSLEVLKEVGLMYQDFFIDYLDYEWCFRANDKGYVHKIISDVKMKHSIGSDSRSIFGIFKVAIHSPFRWYFLFRNGIYICKMPHIPFRFKLEVVLKTIFRFLILPIFSDSKYQTYLHILCGICDGITGRKSSFYKHLVGETFSTT
ncbi:glycosyltransferase [Leptospira interrogans]|uniref:Glycosyltransferase family 2 protein n=4 Tax=Leptospira interrogans TaxID=173 RepID=P71441_LEPIR|nr:MULTISPECIES: glycosyltransferase family 2 protein [Leptospira]APH41940.1 dTDP-rhamnosyl transferase RfbF [Leptospira interrogans serovar Copenhageni/Icterohaemorrhagiae]EMY06106.1 glycosyltransferase, group 2 family protein [Leptospira interrogans str. 2002000626]AAB47845.1 unknown [Leptospira interrogans]AAL49436.1 unknown [Leptospira interrogans]AAS70692.1 dTDP-rhamnosyl transferase [Leptospira interrogans serovar Copenhageni str. Fiocruz L1-130]